MEDRSFDELSKKLASPISRRGALKAFAASVAGAVFVGLDGSRALAVDKKCSGIGGKCNPGHDCCGGLVCNHTGPGANGTCGCPSGTTTCGQTCCGAGLVCNGNGACACPDVTGKPGNAPCGFTPAGKPICCNTCQKCSSGGCVDTCPAGQTCSTGGTCLCTSNGEAPCAGTCCPAGQTCSNGTCVCKVTLQLPCDTGTGAQICCRSDQTCSAHSGCLCNSNHQPPCIDSNGIAVCCQSNQTCDTVDGNCTCATPMCGDICCPTGTTCAGGDCICNSTGNRPCGVDANGNAICCTFPQFCSQGTCVNTCPNSLNQVCGTPSGRVCCPIGTDCATNVNTGEDACVCRDTGHEPCGFDASGTAICCTSTQVCLRGACTDAGMCPQGGTCSTDHGVCCPNSNTECVQDATGRTRCVCRRTDREYCAEANDGSGGAICCGSGQVCQNGKCVTP